MARKGESRGEEVWLRRSCVGRGGGERRMMVCGIHTSWQWRFEGSSQLARMTSRSLLQNRAVPG